MPIVASDLLFKYSVTSGLSGNVMGSIPEASLGRFISTSVWLGGSLNDLFNDTSASDNKDEVADYRCIFIHNNHATLTFLSPVASLSSQVNGGDSITIGNDPIPASSIDSATQATSIPSRLTAPVGVSFSSASISLGDIPPGYCKAIWFKRQPTDSAALLDGLILHVEGDTLP